MPGYLGLDVHYRATAHPCTLVLGGAEVLLGSPGLVFNSMLSDKTPLETS